jgi:hypothetical protein
VRSQYWSFTLYPEAGEGGGSVAGSRRPVPSGRRPDPMRAVAEGARRARGQLRRYCAANGLNRLGTLTYAGEGCHDPLALRADLAVFFKGLRAGVGAGAIPYAWVPQWHPGGHGLHVHFGVGRYVPRGVIGEAWPHGLFHIKLLGNLPVGSGRWAEARLTARYLAGYAGRDLDEGRRPEGLHRYEVAQGFQPGRILVYGESAEDVIERASRYMGSAPVWVWRSARGEMWHGPPACSARWN